VLDCADHSIYLSLEIQGVGSLTYFGRDPVERILTAEAIEFMLACLQFDFEVSKFFACLSRVGIGFNVAGFQCIDSVLL
jgi:hypothetical protein